MIGVHIIKVRSDVVISEAWIVPDDDEDWIYPARDGWCRVYSHPQPEHRQTWATR